MILCMVMKDVVMPHSPVWFFSYEKKKKEQYYKNNFFQFYFPTLIQQ